MYFGRSLRLVSPDFRRRYFVLKAALCLPQRRNAQYDADLQVLSVSVERQSGICVQRPILLANVQRKQQIQGSRVQRLRTRECAEQNRTPNPKEMTRWTRGTLHCGQTLHAKAEDPNHLVSQKQNDAGMFQESDRLAQSVHQSADEKK